MIIVTLTSGETIECVSISAAMGNLRMQTPNHSVRFVGLKFIKNIAVKA